MIYWILLFLHQAQAQAGDRAKLDEQNGGDILDAFDARCIFKGTGESYSSYSSYFYSYSYHSSVVWTCSNDRSETTENPRWTMDNMSILEFGLLYDMVLVLTVVPTSKPPDLI